MKPSKQWSLIAMAVIWLAVIVTSVWSPDFVSGSQQEHLKVSAAINWLWGALVTMAIARIARGRRDAPEGAWRIVGLGTAAVWLVVTVVGLAAPVFEARTDPTRIPIFALIAPIAGLLVTRFLARARAGGAGDPIVVVRPRRALGDRASAQPIATRAAPVSDRHTTFALPPGGCDHRCRPTGGFPRPAI